MLESLLKTLNHPFKCVITTETWNNENILDLCKLNSYDGFHTFRPQNHTYSISGGVSIFCDKIYEPSKNLTLSICSNDLESCVVHLNFNGFKIVVVGIYRPPQGCKQNFIIELETIIDSVIPHSCAVVVAGDFNINLNLPYDSDVLELSSKLHSKYFIPVITKPTRFPPGNLTSPPSTLDQIWTNYLNLSKYGILDFDVTDHLPTFCIFDFPFVDKLTNKIKIESRPFTEKNLEKLVNKLASFDWDSFLDYDDYQNCVSNFMTKINIFYQDSFPIKKKYISQKRFNNKWITNNVKHLINQKSAAYKNFRLGHISKENNNAIKNRLNRQINKMKINFFSSSFEAFKKNSKKCWNTLFDLTGTNKTRRDNISLLENDTEIKNPQDVVDTFSNFFANVGRNLEQLLENNQISPYQHIPRNERNFFLFPVTEEECSKCIANLKITRTLPNQISVKIFKSIRNYISNPLSKILNVSFTTGIFPDSLKLAKLTAVHKKGCKKTVSNYRPISSLPFISKIYERCMTNRIISFFSKFNLFSNKQFGFLKKRSTKDAILDFTETVYDALNAKRHNISVLIDLKSAFDTVNHRILLNKLELYGVRGLGLDWIKTYLTNRENYVALGKTYSTHCTTNIGIPQGSIIGPILFIIYINDLPSVSDHLSATLYADDTNFSVSDINFNRMIPTLNAELSKVYDWTVANRLTINVNKTELLLFTNRYMDLNDDQVILNDNRIGFVSHARFLGVIIDANLDFKTHINHVVGKISRHAGILYKIHKFLTPHAKMLYYNSFILPYLSYNILHWGGTNKTHLEPLEIIHKRIIRTLATGKSYNLVHTNPLFLKLNILKLNDLYRFHAAVDTHAKVLEGHYRSSHNLNTRYRNCAVPKFHRLTRTQQSITFNGPTIWNSLPESIKLLDSLPSFKNHLKTFYIKQYEP